MGVEFYGWLFFWHWFLGYLYIEGIGNPEETAIDAIISAFDELFKEIGSKEAQRMWSFTKLMIFLSGVIDILITYFLRRLALPIAIAGFIIGILTNIFPTLGAFLLIIGFIISNALDHD